MLSAGEKIGGIGSYSDGGFPVEPADAGVLSPPAVEAPDAGFPEHGFPPPLPSAPPSVMTPAQKHFFSPVAPFSANETEHLPVSLTPMEYIASLERDVIKLVEQLEGKFNAEKDHLTLEGGRLVHKASQACTDARATTKEMQLLLIRIEGVSTALQRGDPNPDLLVEDLKKLKADFARQITVYDSSLKTIHHHILDGGFFSGKTAERARDIIMQGLKSGKVQADFRLPVVYLNFNIKEANTRFGADFGDAVMAAMREAAAEIFGEENVSNGKRTNVRVIIRQDEKFTGDDLEKKTKEWERLTIEKAKRARPGFPFEAFRKHFFAAAGFAFMKSPFELGLDRSSVEVPANRGKISPKLVKAARIIDDAFHQAAAEAAAASEEAYRQVKEGKGNGRISRVVFGQGNGGPRAALGVMSGTYQGKLLAGQTLLRLEHISKQLKTLRENLLPTIMASIDGYVENVDRFVRSSRPIPGGSSVAGIDLKEFLKANEKAISQFLQRLEQDPRYPVLASMRSVPEKLDALLRLSGAESAGKQAFMARNGDEIGIFVRFRGHQNGEPKTFLIFLELKEFGAFNLLHHGGPTDRHLNRYLERLEIYQRKNGWSGGQNEITPQALAEIGKHIQRITEGSFRNKKFNRRVTVNGWGQTDRYPQWVLVQNGKKEVRLDSAKMKNAVPIRNGWVGELASNGKEIRMRWRLYRNGKPVKGRKGIRWNNALRPPTRAKVYCYMEQGLVSAGIVFMEIPKAVRSGRILTAIWDRANEAAVESKARGKPVTVDLIPPQEILARYAKNVAGGMVLFAIQDGIYLGAHAVFDGGESLQDYTLQTPFENLGLMAVGGIAGTRLTAMALNRSRSLPLLDRAILERPPVAGLPGLAWKAVPMAVTVSAFDLWHNGRFTAATPIGLVNLSASMGAASLLLKGARGTANIGKFIGKGTPAAWVAETALTALFTATLGFAERKLFESDLEDRYAALAKKIDAYPKRTDPQSMEEQVAYFKLLKEFEMISEEKASYVELYGSSAVGRARREYLEEMVAIGEEAEEAHGTNYAEAHGGDFEANARWIENEKWARIQSAIHSYRGVLVDLRQMPALSSLERARIGYELQILDAYEMSGTESEFLSAAAALTRDFREAYLERQPQSPEEEASHQLRVQAHVLLKSFN